MPSLLERRSSILFLAGAALGTVYCAQAGKFESSSSKFPWVSTVPMALLFRHLFFGTKKFINEPERVDMEEYDIIVVGGGTAGCVLAGRLSEDPKVKVLLLESGISGKSLILTRIPVTFPLLMGSKHMYNYWTEPQPNALGKSKFWPRGKMLGGCSSINASMAQYGSPGDFDQWADISKDDAWRWTNFRRYFTKFEKYAHDPHYPDVDVSVKGKDGPMRVGYHSTVSEGSKDFIKSCTKVGIPYNADFNATLDARGVNRIMTFVDESRTRVSSETGYLTDAVLARPNLKVVLNAQVTKILTEQVGDEIRTTGVEFAKSKDGKRFTARSKRDVILAAGALHSPHLLMTSGIGPVEQLKKFDIPVVRALQGVGSHLVDHPVVDIFLGNKMNDSPTFIQPRGIGDALKLLGAAFTYFIRQRGPLASNFGESAAFCRSDDPLLFSKAEFPEKIADSTSSAHGPDLELFITPLAYKDHGAFMFPMHTFAVHVCLLRPMSRGTVTLKSADPFDDPIMDPNYLSAPEDLQKLMRGMKLILKIAQQEPFAARLDLGNTDPILDHTLHTKSDKEFEDVIRERLESLYHPAGTCRMAPLEENGVVDSKLRVYGVKGLRVCDASIFPEIVSAHPAGAVLATAEHLADIVKAEIEAEQKG